MITLLADNRVLTKGSRYSYLTSNIASGVTSFSVLNPAGFEANKILLIGEIGGESTEIRVVSSVSSSTITITAATSFAHPESTKISIIPFDQVRFYRSATDSYSAASDLSGWISIQPDDWYSRYTDSTNSTGYGFFSYKNSITGALTGGSNSIPYVNFGRSTVKKAIDGFYSLINNNEQKLISFDDALEWLNEAYDIAKSELSIVNHEYDASDDGNSISVVSGTGEYAMETDFGDMLSVWIDDGAGSGTVLEPLDILAVDEYNLISGAPLRYYLRGSYIGFSPEPTSSFTVKYRYNAVPTDLTAYSDVISLPKKAFHSLKDYMLHRAKQKLRHPDSERPLKLFLDKINVMKLHAHNRDNSVDSFGIDPSSNV